MRVSVHIATRDRATELAQLLTTLRMQTFKDWDLVIVDGSKPSPLENTKFVKDCLNRLSCEGHGIQYITEDVPLGVCQARNRALFEDKWEVDKIVRIDDDSILEPDYLQRLHDLSRGNNIGGVGGVVPQWAAPPAYRNPDVLKGIFNQVKFNKGKLEMSDDGGYQYTPNTILPSHHLRSSFMFNRKAALEVKGFSTEYGTVGFREETDFCLKLLMKGYRLLTDTGAIAWHNTCQSGGVRSPDYIDQVQRADKRFHKKFEYLWEKKKFTPKMLQITKVKP